MEILGPCPEAAVFHSACVLAEQVRHTVAASLLCYASLFFFVFEEFFTVTIQSTVDMQTDLELKC